MYYLNVRTNIAVRAKSVKKKEEFNNHDVPLKKTSTTRDEESTKRRNVIRHFPRRSRSRLPRRREIAGDDMTERAAPRAVRWCEPHGEKNAEGCIDPPAARSRRRCAPRQATTHSLLRPHFVPPPLLPPPPPLPTPNDSLVSPSWLFLLSSLARPDLPLHPRSTLYPTPSNMLTRLAALHPLRRAHVDHAARGNISKPG